jgi:hypothetical protein
MYKLVRLIAQIGCRIDRRLTRLSVFSSLDMRRTSSVIGTAPVIFLAANFDQGAPRTELIVGVNCWAHHFPNFFKLDTESGHQRMAV